MFSLFFFFSLTSPLLQAYYRAGFSKFKLSAPDYAVGLFIQGLIRLRGSQDQSQKVDFIVGIFMCINGKVDFRLVLLFIQ